MDVKSQVCALEQAKKLYELGISETGHLFSWVFDSLNAKWDISNRCVESNRLTNIIAYPAFTVSELGVMLGRGIIVHQPTEGRNEAIDRADDLIHLIEIDELDVDFCNERLTH